MTVSIRMSHMQSISTRYVGPGNVRGSRIIATASGGERCTVPYNDALNQDANHAAAAVALCDKLGWKGQLAGGSTAKGYAFVFVDSLHARALKRIAEHELRADRRHRGMVDVSEVQDLQRIARLALDVTGEV